MYIDAHFHPLSLFQACCQSTYQLFEITDCFGAKEEQEKDKWRIPVDKEWSLPTEPNSYLLTLNLQSLIICLVSVTFLSTGSTLFVVLSCRVPAFCQSSHTDEFWVNVKYKNLVFKGFDVARSHDYFAYTDTLCCYHRRIWTWQSKFKSWTRLFAFCLALMPLRKAWTHLFSANLLVNSRLDWALYPWYGN